jgi:hypothetical protein
VIGIVVGGTGVLITVTLFIILTIYSLLYSDINYEPTYEELDAEVEISVHEDGCSVTRSDVEGSTSIDSLTWVVIDPTGEQVLGRNASEEYEYTYYRPGEYRIHLETWHAGRYVPISDEVTINCP